MCWRDDARRWPGVMRQLCRLNRNSADELPHKPASLGFPGKVSDLLQWVGRMRSLHRSCVMRQLCRVRTSCRGLVPPKPSRPVVPFPRKKGLTTVGYRYLKSRDAGLCDISATGAVRPREGIPQGQTTVSEVRLLLHIEFHGHADARVGCDLGCWPAVRPSSA